MTKLLRVSISAHHQTVAAILAAILIIVHPTLPI